MVKTAEILRDAGEEVEIFSGEEPPEALPEGVGFRLIPGMGYHDPVHPTDASDLTKTLSGIYQEGDIWHIHNHSLGKNPAVSDAWIRLAEQGQRVVFQPHDFAEDGRPANLNLLRETFPGFPDRLYPFGPHIRYAVLQERDRQLLAGAGLPQEHIHLLPNPVTQESFTAPQQPPQRVLYLTRAIRRKNIGEFLYWAKQLGDHLEFATSLLPENPVEKKIFDQWRDVADAEGIRVSWGIGSDGRPFREVVEWGDVCMTTSVGEGFGMSFLEPYAMQRSVVGRDLPSITAGFKQDGVDLSHLYGALPVPVDAVDDGFWERSVRSVQSWSAAMGAGKTLSIRDLQAAWVQEDLIDFGRLDEPAQQQVLQSGIASRQPLPFSTMEQNRTNADEIEANYSSVQTLNRLQTLYASFESSGSTEYASGTRVRDAFLNLSSVYLLRT
jgi:hypothetical protein